MTPRITLLTDFGTADGYVAAMKGVLASRVPGVRLDDVAHDLAQGDVEAASRALERYGRLFPRGTVHLVVVDPGVGTERKPLALEADGLFVVAPDNGIVTPLLGGAWRAVEIVHVEAPGAGSATFHGRDVFAPAAAHLASGEPLEALGPPLEAPVRLERSGPERDPDGTVRGRVVSIDRFGNLATDVPSAWLLPGSPRIEIEGRAVRFCRTYADGRDGEPIALIDSMGRLEIAVGNASAARILELGPGAAVVVRR